MTRHSHVRRAGGFTMVELIIVMILAGILGAIGMARFFDRTGFDADAATEQTRAMLRYAQKVAIAQNRSVFVRLDGNSIALCFEYQRQPDCPAANQVRAPSGSNSGSRASQAYCASDSWACEGRPANLSYTLGPAGAYAGASNYFYFNALGRPYAAVDADGAMLSRFAGLSLLIGGDGQNRTVTVEPETGYVH